jgi:hypothetical protein
MCIRDRGEAEFEAALPDLVAAAFGDICTRTNPRMPMVAEIEALLRAAYDTPAAGESPAVPTGCTDDELSTDGSV